MARVFKKWYDHKGRENGHRILGKDLTCKASPQERKELALRTTANFRAAVSSVQSLSRVWLFATPWIAARQASLSITNSKSSLKLTSIESVMPSSHLILCRPLLLLPPIPPRIRVFSMSQLFAWGDQSTGVSALASVLSKKSQGWSPSEWTGWISF